MAEVTLRALAWRHRRATGPLKPLTDSFRATHPDVAIEWTDRTLAGFEHQPILETAKAFDLIIYDHPFSGDIVAANAFLPLDVALPDLLGPDADGLYIGPTLASYRFGGAVWGAPIDAATEHALFRADLLAGVGEAVPQSWPEVIALGQRLRRRGLYLGAAVVTPHLGLVAGALMANAGHAWTTDPAQQFTVEPAYLAAALENLREFTALCPPESRHWNSIDLHEAMVARDDIAYAPCVYGYATYGEPDMRARLSFADFPGTTMPYAAGSAIGGTAMGVSAFTGQQEAALAFVRHALSAEAQVELIGRHHGQPARIEAWDEAALDRQFNGYFSGVRASMEQAWIRPRLKGYIPFQHEAGRVVERLARGETTVSEAVTAITALAAQVG